MIELHNAECLEFMRGMPDNSVDAIVTDPPYFGVKDDDWDNQWKDADAFIAWIGELSEQWQRILKPNGSLYCFASPQMSWAVEGEIRKRFNVLCNVRWQKPPYSTRAEMFRKEDLRSYFPASETIIFAEQFGDAYGEAEKALHRDVFSPLGRYLQTEWERAGWKAGRVGVALGYDSALPTRWAEGSSLPTPDAYRRLRELLSGAGGDYLRREYEDLRREYEELRRPFNVTADVPYTDVWTFRTVQAYDGKHVCEKPIALMEHIILASTKPGAIVFDPFMGSGSTGVACVLNGRKFVGCEMDQHWHKYASRRIQKAASQPRLFDAPKDHGTQMTMDAP